MNRLVVLGSGTALPDADRENSCYAWCNPAGILLLDCGGSPYRRMLKYGLNPRDVRAVFISHNHPDHLMGLPTLLLHLWLAQYQHELHVFGNETTMRTAQAVVQAAELGIHAIKPIFHALPDSGGIVNLPCDIGERMWTAPTYHSRPTLALRMESDLHPPFVYGADSGPCDALVELARDAHTLVHECTVSQHYDSHATPEEAAETAAQAKVKRIILTHYSPINTAPEHEVIERASLVFNGSVQIAHDGDSFTFRRLKPQKLLSKRRQRAMIEVSD